MTLSRQVHFPWLVLTVTLMFCSVPAQFVPGPYEFCGPNDIIVGVNTTSPPFIIQSTNFGRDNYPDRVNCSLTFATSLDPVVLSFFFRHFDVEFQQFCGYDSLTVNGVKYCGSWEVGRVLPVYLPARSVSTLRFTTDSSVRKSGFEIVVIPDGIVNNQGSTGPDYDDTPSK